MTDPVSPSDRIDAMARSPGDWRDAMLAHLRALIRAADPEVIETVKWIKPSNPDGVAVWDHAGILCTGEVYKAHVKVTFAHGAALDDPAGMFNAGFGGDTRRAIDLHEGETIDDAAFVALVRQAVTLNTVRRANRRP